MYNARSRLAFFNSSNISLLNVLAIFVHPFSLVHYLCAILLALVNQMNQFHFTY